MTRACLRSPKKRKKNKTKQNNNNNYKSKYETSKDYCKADTVGKCILKQYFGWPDQPYSGLECRTKFQVENVADYGLHREIFRLGFMPIINCFVCHAYQRLYPRHCFNFVAKGSQIIAYNLLVGIRRGGFLSAESDNKKLYTQWVTNEIKLSTPPKNSYLELDQKAFDSPERNPPKDRREYGIMIIFSGHLKTHPSHPPGLEAS